MSDAINGARTDDSYLDGPCANWRAPNSSDLVRFATFAVKRLC